ncbi:MAG: ABC transporter ATP-binding protein [Lachnospiraceae bacterium]
MMERIRKCKLFFGEKANIRITILFLLPLMVSVFETFGISAIASYVTLILDESSLETSWWMKALYDMGNYSRYSDFVLFTAFALILFYVVKTVFLIVATQIQTIIVKHATQETASKVLKIIEKRPYEYFTKVNVAEIIRIANDDVARSMDYVTMVLDLFKEALVSAFILIFLLIQDTQMTLFILGFLGICMVALRLVTKRKVAILGKMNQLLTKDKIKWLNQTIYGIKDIKIGQTEDFFSDEFDDANKRATKLNIRYTFWLNSPAYVIEMIVMVCILFYIIVMIKAGTSYASLVPTMTTFALAAVRLLPACNRISSFLTRITYRRYSVDVLYGILVHPEESEEKRDNKQITMEEGITFSDVSFRYEGTERKIMDHVNVKIETGKAIGIMGPSGAGKTTFVDLLLGLLEPQEGTITADGINIKDGYSSYLDHISYIPQTIFLIDDTIRNNVAFGIPKEEVSDEKVMRALEDAQLDEYVKSLPDGLDTIVGERGIRISGGQRQRIGIARALYKNPSLLVLDEATSALDNETEAAIMESINHLKGRKTMVIIAHRLSTIADCDIIYRVKDGKVEPTKLDEVE